MKARLAVLLFLGSVFLAAASVGLARSEEENSAGYLVCVKRCGFQNDASYLASCHARCNKLTNDQAEKEEAAERDPRLRPWQPKEREPGREEEPEEGSDSEREKEQDRPHRRPSGKRGQQEEDEGQGEQQEQEEEKQQQENPYYIPSDKFQTRFENEHGRIRVLQRFDKLSRQLRMLQYYRIVEYRARPGTLIVPHHSDAEYLLINTRGRALVTIVLQNYKRYFNLERFDVLRVPAGAICYTVNRANDQDLEFIKLALPVNIPGQFENFYPSGSHIPESYLKAFHKKTLQAAYNAPYEEIERALWGSEEQQEQQGQGSEEGVIVKLQRKQLRSLIRRAQSSLSSYREEKESPLGPLNLRNIQGRYSNDHGSFHEAHPHHNPPLEDLGIGVSHLKLNEGSLFMPHFNTRAIILAFVADGEGHTEMACPHLANQQQQQEGEGEEQQERGHKEGQIKRLEARLSRGDLYIVPAGHPVAVRASNNNNLEVVEFVLNAPYNHRNFLAGKGEVNVLNEIDREVKDAVFEGSGEQVERLFNRQRESFFVDREEQPSGSGGRRSPPRKGHKVAWSSFLTAFM